jgi:hypothetical protein
MSARGESNDSVSGCGLDDGAAALQAGRTRMAMTVRRRPSGEGH